MAQTPLSDPLLALFESIRCMAVSIRFSVSWLYIQLYKGSGLILLALLCQINGQVSAVQMKVKVLGDVSVNTACVYASGPVLNFSRCVSYKNPFMPPNSSELKR